MFFTIVIPTYNPRKYLPDLLESITHNKCLDEIEVIISDDRSTDDFGDILKEFKTLNIRKIVNSRHHGFPRTGRQNGADAAEGEWITFADQDDLFVDNIFDDILAYIKENDVHYCIFGNFIERLTATGEEKVREGNKAWTHGKFYEKIFLRKNNIRYGDFDYCEDISFSTIVDCVAVEQSIEFTFYEKPVYIWRRRPDSLADDTYFERSMPDYITATMGVLTNYIEKYKNNEQKKMEYNIRFIANLLHIYFYYQTPILNKKRKSLLDSMTIVQKYFTRYKEATGFTTYNIIFYINTDLVDLYNLMRTQDYSQIPFVEQISFQDWLLMYIE